MAAAASEATAFLSSVLPSPPEIEPHVRRTSSDAGAPQSGLARQSSGERGGDEGDGQPAAGAQDKPRRKRKRKRKRRSSATKAQGDGEEEDGAVSESGASVLSQQGEPGSGQKRRRTRNRGTPRRKPWSQMTWEEKQAVEERESQMAAQRERERPELPMDPNGHVPRGVNPRDYRPAAPRNTTQELLKDAHRRERLRGNETPSSGHSDNDRGADFDGSMGDDVLDLGGGSMAAAFNARLSGHPTPARSPEDTQLQATVKRQKDTINRLESEVAALRAQLQVRLAHHATASPAAAALITWPLDPLAAARADAAKLLGTNHPSDPLPPLTVTTNRPSRTPPPPPRPSPRQSVAA